MTEADDQNDVGPVLRPARPDDIPVLERLIQVSARALGHGFNSERETEALIAHVFGVDSDLIADGPYLVAERRQAVIGCGGWSRRRTLFGGDRFTARDASFLDPATDAARIRAFFVAPNHARQGVAAGLLKACERDAARHGFTGMTLMATLPGVPFYVANGYRAGAPIEQLCGELKVRLIPMEKAVNANTNRMSSSDM